MTVEERQHTRIGLINNPDILQKTLRDFLTDLGYEVLSITGSELRHWLHESSISIHLAIIPHTLGKASLQAFHQAHPETMIVLLDEGRGRLSVDDAVAYGVYAFLRPPIHLNELEVLLFRLRQYQTAQYN